MTVGPDDLPLQLNVAGLLGEAPGAYRDIAFEDVTLDLGEDLVQAEPAAGRARLARTNRGLLVTAHFTTALGDACGRCLAPVHVPLDLDLVEEVLPSLDIATGLPLDRSREPDVPRLSEHHELDLAMLLREAIQLAAPIAPLCRPDCRGLCPVCGADLNLGAHDHPDGEIDPRLEALRRFRPDETA